MISRSLSDVEAAGGFTLNNGLGTDSAMAPEVEGASSALAWGCSETESFVTGVSWTGRKDDSFSGSRADAFSRRAVAEEFGSSETTSLAASFRRCDGATHGTKKRSRREIKDTRGEDGVFGTLCLAADFGEDGCSTAVDEWAPSELACAPFRETRVG